ncbi:lupus La protein-like [Ostrea edulis]|uniref:lupus La protein-like n=1 Tax=Ostrea edulis TaxID=37623 RepID=UPI0020948F04|nr:lupus La protein-like [Ostrea edulis]XP_048776659.1 lupus La protein-like [Ostrea edulis]
MADEAKVEVKDDTTNGNASTEKKVVDDVKEDLGPPNTLEKKIIRQLEYYFGDTNLPRDKFLQDEMKIEDGWVSLATMTKFNRLKQLTTNHKLIATALRKASSGLIQVSKDNVFIRRNPDMSIPENTEERRNDFNERSAYVKGFPLNVSLDTLIAFFEKISPVDTVYMRRDQEKKFKGSVFVTFTKKEDCDKFVAEPESKYEESILIKKSKTQYFKEREDGKKQKKLEQLRRKKEDQQRRETEEQQKLVDSITKGAVLHLTGIVSEELTMEDFRTLFNDYATVAWVDYEKGDSQAWIRFNEANTAKPTLEKVKADHDGKLELFKCVLEGRILEGDEELDHWRKIFKDMADSRNRFKVNRKRRHGKGGGGGGKMKRKKEDGGEDEEEDGDEDGDGSDGEGGDAGD